jgi:hypothetical protein
MDIRSAEELEFLETYQKKFTFYLQNLEVDLDHSSLEYLCFHNDV